MKNKTYIFLLGIISFLAFGFNQPNFNEIELVEVVGLNNDTTNYQFVQNQQLYAQGWDTLAQPHFWRELMTMEDDSALINVGSTRQIIKKVAVADWNMQTETQKDAVRDSVKTYYGLTED